MFRIQFRRRLYKAIAILVLLFAGYTTSVIFPKWAFAHVGGTESLRIHSAIALPPVTEALAARVEAQLETSGLPMPTHTLHLYVTGNGWRRVWFFGRHGYAAGIAHPVIAPHHAFLADADLVANRMRKANLLVPLPRSATFYAVHELAHVLTQQAVGSWDYVQMDPILREGIADYVALGPAPKALLDAVKRTSGDDPDTALRDRWGPYPTARAMLTHVLVGGRGIADLLAR